MRRTGGRSPQVDEESDWLELGFWVLVLALCLWAACLFLSFVIDFAR